MYLYIHTHIFIHILHSKIRRMYMENTEGKSLIWFICKSRILYPTCFIILSLYAASFSQFHPSAVHTCIIYVHNTEHTNSKCIFVLLLLPPKFMPPKVKGRKVKFMKRIHNLSGEEGGGRRWAGVWTGSKTHIPSEGYLADGCRLSFLVCTPTAPYVFSTSKHIRMG